MKITSIDVYDFGKCLNYEDCSPICIRINTDAGISGFGEVWPTATPITRAFGW